MSVDVLAVMIPIVAIVMGIGLAMVETVTGYLRRRTLIELHHKERLAAIEKGVEVPPLPEGLLDIRPASTHRTLLHGLVWLFVGIGLLFALPLLEDELSYIGLIPGGVGVAYLIYYIVVGRKEAERTAANRGSQPL